jgi:hypothetical protein
VFCFTYTFIRFQSNSQNENHCRIANPHALANESIP